MYRNYIEVVVNEMLTPLLSEYKKTNPDICTCDKCSEDIKALALNNMPPQYVVEEKGNILKRVDYDLIGGRAHVTSELIKAIQIVSSNPKHG
ncbi:MAG: late competence development ComFB family protein [Peptococcaceae bacterium]|nr:late competence development ComFB family protein [Peptococcaceae bacterium]